MLEIPGEEAATDPGLEARKRQEAVEAMLAVKAAGRRRMMLAVGAVASLLAGGLAYRQVLIAEEERFYEIPDAYIVPMDALRKAQQPAPVVEAPGVEAPAVPKPARNPAGKVEPGAPSPESLATAPVSSGGADALVKFTPGTSRTSGDLAVAGSTSGARVSGIGNVDIAVRPTGGAVLSTDEEIGQMAKAAIGAYGPQVETCVAQRTKVDESFGGAWRAEFVIQPDGSVKKVKVVGQDKADAELEACMARAIGSWRFEKIAREFPVRKTYRFAS